MLKFLFITDTHFRDDTPKGRIDDILESQFAELGELIQICRDREVDALLHGGDFFNTKKPSHKLMVHMLNWVKMLNLPIFGVIGNHDITGYNLESVKNSGLGVLFECGAVEQVDHWEYADKKVIVKAVHSSLDFQQNYMFDEKYNDYTRILISHNYVIPADSMPWGFIHPKDIKTNAHLVLCGHYHVPYDYSTPMTRWINPGALSRWKITERNHTPQALLITVDNGKYEVEYIKLKSSKSGFEIYDEELIKVQKQQEYNIEQFAQSLEATSFQDVDIEKVIQTVGQEQNVEQKVLDLILTKIKEAKEVLK